MKKKAICICMTLMMGVAYAGYFDPASRNVSGETNVQDSLTLNGQHSLLSSHPVQTDVNSVGKNDFLAEYQIKTSS